MGKDALSQKQRFPTCSGFTISLHFHFQWDWPELKLISERSFIEFSSPVKCWCLSASRIREALVRVSLWSSSCLSQLQVKRPATSQSTAFFIRSIWKTQIQKLMQVHLPAFFHSVNVVEVSVCGFPEKYFSSALDKRCLSAPDNILVPPATAVCTVCITPSLLFSMVQNNRDSFETISVASHVRSSAQFCSLSWIWCVDPG